MQARSSYGYRYALFLTAILLLSVLAIQALSMVPPGSEYTPEDIAKLMLEVPRVSDGGLDRVTLSPDGRSLVYSVVRASVEENRRTTELWLQRLTASGEPDGAAIRLESVVTDQLPAIFFPAWSPTGRVFKYFAPEHTNSGKEGPTVLLRYNVATGSVSRVPVNHAEGPARRIGPDQMPALRIATVGGNYRWSPSGRHIAFTARLTNRKPVDRRRSSEVRPSTDSDGTVAPQSGLFVLDMETGVLNQVSPDDINAGSSFDWSPDEKALVFGWRSDFSRDAFANDLAILDLATRTVRPLVKQPGNDSHPAWSPDNKWIAFVTTAGELHYTSGFPAVISAQGGAIRRFDKDDDIPLGSQGIWTPDSRGFYYESAHHLVNKLVYASVDPVRVEPVLPESLNFDSGFSFSADKRTFAFVRESRIGPAEVFVQTLPKGQPHAVTDVSKGFPLTRLVRADRVSWPSRDGRFTVHGILMTPRDAWTADGKKVKSPLPTLVYGHGGPSMVRASFAGDALHGTTLAMAARGYAVLTPNNRGRPGYGEKLRLGLRDGNSSMNGFLPFEDTMAGVDMLVKRGIADKNRLGIYGHSNGANITAYAITQTNRFRAALIREAARLNLITENLLAYGESIASMREGLGVLDPFNPEARKRMIAETPFFHLDHVTTPTYLMFGAHGGATAIGRPLFNGLLGAGKVPVRFTVSDGGHGTWYPAAQADELVQVANWFDYWVRDMPYPDKEREKEYNAWKAKRAAEKQNTAGTAANKPKAVNTAKRP